MIPDFNLNIPLNQKVNEIDLYGTIKFETSSIPDFDLSAGLEYSIDKQGINFGNLNSNFELRRTNLEYLNIFKVSNINTALRFLKSKDFWISAFDNSAKKDFTENDWKGRNVLLFGSEGFGMREHTKKYTDFSVKIEMNKKIESLNISNSAAIVFHYINQYKNKT